MKTLTQHIQEIMIEFEGMYSEFDDESFEVTRDSVAEWVHSKLLQIAKESMEAVDFSSQAPECLEDFDTFQKLKDNYLNN